MGRSTGNYALCLRCYPAPRFGMTRGRDPGKQLAVGDQREQLGEARTGQRIADAISSRAVCTKELPPQADTSAQGTSISHMCSIIASQVSSAATCDALAASLSSAYKALTSTARPLLGSGKVPAAGGRDRKGPRPSPFGH
ncbi:hypothetical protein HaLaN_31868 [Haematococcus lacustris]|uniref:Uncharacterized protein n=1 Tax=Haematococcus lacustris TaxID=44745 RepID=A0A6A0AK09_HAELA|nr:hypothetical protein HaLaN_31868 [Haematococcus lacustris]